MDESELDDSDEIEDSLELDEELELLDDEQSVQLQPSAATCSSIRSSSP